MIYSPSYKRSDFVKTHKLIPDVVYCVCEFEAEKYKDEGHDVEVMPDSVAGNIAKTRNYIKKNFIDEENDGKGVMIDDDIEAIVKWNFNDEGQPIRSDLENPTEWIEKAFILLKDSDYRLFGVNVVSDKGGYREYTPFSTLSFVSAALMGFLDNDLYFDERIPLKEDYDYTIQNCNVYRGLLRFNMISLIKKDHGNKGGCADMRSMLKEKEQFKMLQNKWGNKIVKEDSKSSKRTAVFDLNPIIKVPIKGV